MSKRHVSQIQTGLAGLGYDAGPIDGIIGPRTRMAALRFGQGQAPGPVPAPTLPPSSAAMLFQGKHPVTEVVIHCSATRRTWMERDGLFAQVAEIRRWHVEDNGWRDIGYHWIIGRDGQILPGRRETEVGAGVIGRNSGVIHICLIGGHGSGADDAFQDHFTPAQDTVLRAQLSAIGLRTRLSKITGHNDYARKACPGFRVGAWLKGAA